MGSSVSQSRLIEDRVYQDWKRDSIKATVPVQILLMVSGSQPAQTTEWQAKPHWVNRCLNSGDPHKS